MYGSFGAGAFVSEKDKPVLCSTLFWFLDTDVFKGPRLSTLKIFDLQTHFKTTETFQYTNFSSYHPFSK